MNQLSTEAQDGLRRWAAAVFNDEMALDDIGGIPAAWAWVCFLLRESADLPEWFPKGKWATTQFIEAILAGEAHDEFSRAMRERAKSIA